MFYVYVLIYILSIQEGFSSLYFSGSTQYATFGPFLDLCITAPSTCTLGFTFGLWIKKGASCTSAFAAIATTCSRNNPTESEGIWIRCEPDANSIVYRMYVAPESHSIIDMPITSGADTWYYATMVWNIGTALKIYENGTFIADGSWSATGWSSIVNTVRELTFGRLFTDHNYGYATGNVDGVRIFNRPLNDAEVLTLYNSYST